MTVQLLNLTTATVLVTVAVFACSPQEEKPTVQRQMFEMMTPIPAQNQQQELLFASKFEIYQRLFFDDPAQSSKPVAMLSRAEASSWAAKYFCRLPSLSEWMQLRGELFAFSQSGGIESANNIESQAFQSYPVGVFEGGRNEMGLYDLYGNVWEWLADDYQGTNLPAFAGARHAQAIGGSWANSGYNYLEPRVVEASERSSDLGFRVVADADLWVTDCLIPLWSQKSNRNWMLTVMQSWHPLGRKQLIALMWQNLPSEMLAALK